MGLTLLIVVVVDDDPKASLVSSETEHKDRGTDIVVREHPWCKLNQLPTPNLIKNMLNRIFSVCKTDYLYT